MREAGPSSRYGLRPAAESPRSPMPDAADQQPSPADPLADPLRVLLVEDDPFVRLPLARALASRGFHVETASRGADVLAMVERCRPAVIVLDLGLPDVSGLTVLGAVQSRDPRLAVVMLSGAAERTVTRRALELGATDFLLKPVTADALAEVVRRAARRRAGQVPPGDPATFAGDRLAAGAEPPIAARARGGRS